MIATGPARSLAGSRVLLGVCGGVAAYRACELARELLRAGASVQCVLTPHAAQFVSALTFQALTGQPALIDEFPQPGTNVSVDVYAHLNLTRGIDVFVIAPLTATTLAELATGRAANLLTACYLSNTAPLVLAPAMNSRMWQHPAVQGNLALLRARGHLVVEPGSGALACGDEGPGRLAELPEIVAAIEGVLASRTAGGESRSNFTTSAAERHEKSVESSTDTPTASSGGANVSLPLSGRRLIVTAGGTREYLDPVRFITNASTGTLALSVAEALLDLGAEVELIASEIPVSAALSQRLTEREGVRTAFDMQQAIASSLPQADGLIMFAAVADYSPVRYSSVKRKKDGANWTVELTETPDILKSLHELRRADQVVVAVSLEDEDWLARAVKKASDKHVNLMLAVELGADLPFGDRRLNCALLVDGTAVLEPARRDKAEIAEQIATWLANTLGNANRHKEAKV